MSINSYTQPGANTTKLDLTNVVVAAGNTDLVTAQNNAYGKTYLQTSLQTGYSIFDIYVCINQAVSLIVKRYVLSQGYYSMETLPVEVASQPNWHSIAVAAFDQINFQLSGAATIQKLVVMEPKYAT